MIHTKEDVDGFLAFVVERRDSAPDIDPGIGSFGTFGSHAGFPFETTLVRIFSMWIGRLEIVPVLAVFTDAFWKR
ncbi:MAG: hypothetical protein ACQET5_10120 [Halobacteriota archaeon]|uniref:hypothetical protein n=1 Tax=Natronomonas sp. TaxID=2184060 RepID=UPI0039770F7B